MNIVLTLWLFIKDQLHDVISNEENLLNRIKSLESVDFEKEQKAMRDIRVIFSMPHPCYLPATLNATYAKSKSINLKKSNEQYFTTQF